MDFKKSKKGLTLIEIIISIAILAIIVVPLSNLTMSAIKFNSESSYKQKALAAAQKEMEYVKSLDFTGEGSYSYPEKDGLIVTRNVSKVDDYKSEGIKTNITPVAYTTKLDVYNRGEDGEVIDKVIINNDVTKTLMFTDITDRTLSIINTKTETKIQIVKNEIIYDTETIAHNLNETISIRIELHGSKKLKLSVENTDKSGFLSLYFIKHKDSSKYKIDSSIGKVKVYSEIAADAESTDATPTSNFRVYKVEVEVKKAKNNEIIQRLEGYKTVVK